MAYILHIESSTKMCSVALSYQGHLHALREQNGQDYSHSSLLTTFIEEIIHEAGISMKELSAVAVSQGPGSYTGLRIGVSAAKGLCYGLSIPLIAINSLEAMAYHFREGLLNRSDFILPAALEALFCPMIDARRMEVYYALYDARLREKQKTRAEVITGESFESLLEKHKVFFFGDGAAKCRPLINSTNAMVFNNIWPSAKGMIALAQEKYQTGEYEDLAYFEPFYLKDFLAGKPNVKGLA
ncbi:MAG: tRNA (adenosine(37)-N6)-threonylcarbamoyltransferase complex dimerization subunit type 1 TsaB [Bacteroidales bacterium]